MVDCRAHLDTAVVAPAEKLTIRGNQGCSDLDGRSRQSTSS